MATKFRCCKILKHSFLQLHFDKKKVYLLSIFMRHLKKDNLNCKQFRISVLFLTLPMLLISMAAKLSNLYLTMPNFASTLYYYWVPLSSDCYEEVLLYKGLKEIKKTLFSKKFLQSQNLFQSFVINFPA